MLRGLRLRLAALFTGLTALVLAGALAANYHLAAGQYAAGQQALHQAALAGLTAQLSQGRVRDAWLAELEADGPYFALIEDNGRLLDFAGARQAATPRAELWRLLRGRIAAGGAGNAGSTLVGAAGEEYSVQAVTLRPGGGPAAARSAGPPCCAPLPARRHFCSGWRRSTLRWAWREPPCWA